METNPGFDNYMDRYFDFKGMWDSPSRCGLKIVNRKDGKVLVIATEIFRQNPGTSVTEWCAPLASQVLKITGISPELFIFVEHTPDLRSKLAFYEETFDRVAFEWDGEKFINPKWSRLTREQIDAMMAE
jgi:hypothetical protein